MSMHKGLIGQPDGGASAELTLGDYIARKTRHDAFDQVAREKKLPFSEWYVLNKNKISFDYTSAQIVWEAAQENYQGGVK